MVSARLAIEREASDFIKLGVYYDGIECHSALSALHDAVSNCAEYGWLPEEVFAEINQLLVVHYPPPKWLIFALEDFCHGPKT